MLKIGITYGHSTFVPAKQRFNACVIDDVWVVVVYGEAAQTMDYDIVFVDVDDDAFFLVVVVLLAWRCWGGGDSDDDWIRRAEEVL